MNVVVYRLNGDNNNSVVNDYIDNQDDDVFNPVEDFLKNESEKYHLITKRPIKIQIGSALNVHPPELPGNSYMAVIWWSLKFRYWTYKNTSDTDGIRVFVLYHEATKGRALQHSVGIDKGLYAVVNAFADVEQDQQNNIVLAHELLHTVGATDKYDVKNNAIFPIGYADPDQSPLYPQINAEIMVGRVPLSETSMRMADSLTNCIIGEQTAKEINWLHKK